MMSPNWLLRGFELGSGRKAGKKLSGDHRWQLYSTNSDGYALIVLPELVHQWMKADLVPSTAFENITVAQSTYQILYDKHDSLVSSVQYGPFPETNMEARAFAIALRQTRKLAASVSLHDAVYIERLSRLLPTYTDTAGVEDQTVLGKWLSGGVDISTDSFDRLCTLLSWMDPGEVEDIVREAGFAVRNGALMTGIRHQKDHEEKAAMRDARQRRTPPEPGARFSLPGRPFLENFINEHIVHIVLNEEKYKRMGINFPSAMVLYGPPGCGKKYAVDKLIDFLGWPSFDISSGSIGSPFIHDTSKKIAEIFDAAIESAPSVVVIDEMEAFLTARDMAQSSGLHHVEEVAEFLRRIPEAAQKHVLVIAMTNMIESIDAAVLRRGRFDHIVEVKMPSKEEVAILLRLLLADVPVTGNIDLDGLSEQLQGHPVSDVTFVAKEAGRIAVKTDREAIDSDILRLAFDLIPKLNHSERRIGFVSGDVAKKMQ